MSAEQVFRDERVATGSFEPLRNWAQEVLALANRWSIELRRERLNLLFTVVQPAIWMVFFGTGVGRTVDKGVIGTNDYIGFMLPGIIAFTVVGNGVSGAMPLMWDKETGYLDKLMSMPIARSSVIVSRLVFQVCLDSVQVLIVLAVALALDVRVTTGVGGIVVVILAASLLTMAFSSAFAALAYAVPGHGTFFAVTGFITLPLLFMSNAFVPLDAMPTWMNVIARLNPLTYGISAMRSLVVGGWEASIAGNLAVLAAFAAACLAVGTNEFRRQTGDRVR